MSVIDSIRRHAADVTLSLAQSRWGFVVSVDPVKLAVRLNLQPENTLTGWLPICLAGAGSGFTVAAIPDTGWLAFVVPDVGHQDSMVVVGFAHSDPSPLPQVPNEVGSNQTQNTDVVPAVAGEVIVRDKSGSVMRFCANGDILIQPKSGTLWVDGRIVANGDVFDFKGSLDTLRGEYNVHRHTQGSDSHGDSEVPTDMTDHPDPDVPLELPEELE